MNRFANFVVRLLVLCGLLAGAFIIAPTAIEKLADKFPAARSPLVEPPIALSELSKDMPDGADFKPLFGAARTVGDLNKANELVQANVTKLTRVETGLNAWHRDVSTNCSFVEALDTTLLDPLAIKAAAMQTVVADIKRRMKDSLDRLTQAKNAKPPQGQATPPSRTEPADNRAPYSAQADLVAQYRLVYEDFARIHIEVVLRAQTIAKLASVSIPTMAASCTPAEIPPLFAETAK